MLAVIFGTNILASKNNQEGPRPTGAHLNYIVTDMYKHLIGAKKIGEEFE